MAGSELHSGPGFGRLGLTLAEVAGAMGAEVAAEAAAGAGAGGPAATARLMSAKVSGITTDSRTAGPGVVFVAIKGPRHDGRSFAASALAAGSPAVVAAPGPPIRPPAGGLVLEVPDTVRALGDLARFVRRRVAPRLVAVTGSVGKTTVKECLRRIFEAEAGPERVLATSGNLNNHVGLPLTLLSMGPEVRLAVVEMGASMPGEIAYLASVAEPDAGLVTAVAAAHLEGFGSLEAIALAKGELFAGLGPEAVAVANADDPLVVREAARFPGNKLHFGTSPRAADGPEPAVTAAAIEDLGLAGQRLLLKGPGMGPGKGTGGLEVRTRLIGPINALNAAAAAAAAVAVGVGWDAVAEGLSKAEAPEGRLRALDGIDGIAVIDDGYNANPASMEAALRLLGQLPAPRAAILGDMLELGAESAELHRLAGILAAGIGLESLAVVGEASRRLGRAAVEAGLDRARLGYFDDPAAAARWTAAGLPEGSHVLVKGSRGMAMERAVQALTPGPPSGGGSGRAGAA